MSETVDRLSSQDLQAINLAIETHMDRYREPIPNQTFNRYSRLMIKIQRHMELELLHEWAEYRHHGEKLTLQDEFYWTVDHMGILPGDIKRVQDRAEGAIRTYYKDDDLDWGYLDLIRRTLHAIELLEDNYIEIRTYVDQARTNAEATQEVGE